MKNFLFVIIAVFIGLTGVSFADDLRDYDGIQLGKGTFVPVISTQEISTLYCDVGTVEKFISTTDLYLYETNIIPKNTEFFGHIEKINEPVVGTNASMIIKIDKLRLSDGFEMPVNGYIYTGGSTLIGGEITTPETFDKKVSFRQGYRIMVGYVPGPSLKMGEQKVIASGADLMVVLVAPLYVTHTVMN